MANAWPTHQRDYVPSTLDDPILAGQRQNPDTSAATQNCFCPICSRTTDVDHEMTGGTIIQDPSPPVVSVVPYANQNVGVAHPAGSAATGLPNTSMVRRSTSSGVYSDTLSSGLAESSLQQYQESARYGPLHEVDPPQVEMGMAPNEDALDLSVPERLRRLAGRYVSDPNSTVNGVHLEPGPSGRFQVVITIDIGDILTDTTN